MLTNLRQIYAHWSLRRRAQFYSLLVLIVISAFAEMVSVGAIVPVLYVLLGHPASTGTMALSSGANAFILGLHLSTIQVVWLFSAAVILSGLIRIFTSFVLCRFAFVIGADLSVEIYTAILGNNYEWHVNHNSSESLSAIQKITNLVLGMSFQLFQGMLALAIFITVFAVMLFINPVLSIGAALSFSLLYLLLTLTFKKQLLANSKVQAELETRRVQEVQEGLGSIRDVIINRTQQWNVDRLARTEYLLRRVQAANFFYGLGSRYVIEAAVLLAFIGIASAFVNSPAGFIAVAPVLGGLALGAQKLLPQLQQIYTSWTLLAASTSSLDDVVGLLRELEPAQRQAAAHPVTAEPIPAALPSVPLIALKDVAFRYRGAPANVLEGVSIEVATGTHVGFVGRTGSGKSTLMDLMLGLLKPTDGTVEINGAPLSDSNLESWQSALAHVPQVIYLADASIADNIALGVPSDQVDFDRIREAAAKAQLAEFIDGLPEGYRTQVGERGVRLSGGQRQRIGLARALYRRPSVLFFDEATSALDSETEQSVVEAVRGLGSEYTIVTIAHRASTLLYCDRTFEVADGHVAPASLGPKAVRQTGAKR
jgi:ABC-type multidrug transport system fused ATPase/permease subunit